MPKKDRDNIEAPAPAPPAPPLPPQPSSARAAASAFARFINYGSRPALPGPEVRLGSLESNSTGGASRFSSITPSKDASHKTGIPIAALDISPCRTRAVLAGRDILKTVVVSGSSCVEDCNVRERLIRYAATHSTVAEKRKVHLAATDVKWSNGNCDSIIATAAANGQVAVYDLHRLDFELARLHEHNRQIHRLGFNPHLGNLLLSGSQDSTIKLWDLRVDASRERSVLTCQSKSTFVGHSDGIRDLQWSPTNGVEFAAATDSGVIQRWDITMGSLPICKINAHERGCNALDWHPDGKHLISGGADKELKVWDFSSSDRKMKPMWQLRTPQAALHVRWRPPSWSSVERNRPGKWQCTQVAVSYDKEDPRIHVWDLRRPSVPYCVLDRYDTPATGLLWCSENLLWSVGSAGMFTQTDLQHSSKMNVKRNANPLSISCKGLVVFASNKQKRHEQSLQDEREGMQGPKSQESVKPEGENSSQMYTSRSYEEQTSAMSTIKSRLDKAPSSLKSARSNDSTPPSTGTGGPVCYLDESLREDQIYKTTQRIACGYVPGIFDADVYKFMAVHYKPPPISPLSEENNKLHLIFSQTFNHNAIVASRAGEYRLAQSWKILGFAVEKELGRRAERNHCLRLALSSSKKTGKFPQGATPSSNLKTSRDFRQNDQGTRKSTGSKLKFGPPNLPKRDFAVRDQEHEGPIMNHEDMQPTENIQCVADDGPAKETPYIESDFYPRASDSDHEAALPWSATSLLSPLITYHVESLADVQLPAYLLLHLAPWIQVSMHHFRAQQIIQNYHKRLESLRMYVQAAELRKHALEFYPEIANAGGYQTECGGAWCTTCDAPSKGRSQYCERCKQLWATCSVCHGARPITHDRKVGIDTVGARATFKSSANDRLWGWCQLCGHGGHMGCLRAIWEDYSSAGSCPTYGCPCDCAPGQRRDEVQQSLEKTWKQSPSKPMVISDDWNVGESNAVQRTRSMINSEGGQSVLPQRSRSVSNRATASTRPLSLIAAGRSASGDKRVRIVMPCDEQTVGETEGDEAVEDEQRMDQTLIK